MIAPTTPSPYAVFARARQYFEAAHYPAQFAYGITVTVTANGKESSAHYHAYYDARTNAVRLSGVSDEELAHPYTPHGINTVLNLFTGSIPMSAPQQSFDYLGVPLLAPNYTFGIAPYVPPEKLSGMPLVNAIRREFNDPGKPQTHENGSGGIKTIASIEVVHRHYTMRFGATGDIVGHPDYHLLLQPLQNPGRYRLRELWVDIRTFAVDRLVTQGNFVEGGMTGVQWTTTFRQIGGAPYIESERTTQQFSLLRHHYDGASVRFTGIAPAQIPPYLNLATFRTNPITGLPPLTEPPAENGDS